MHKPWECPHCHQPLHREETCADSGAASADNASQDLPTVAPSVKIVELAPPQPQRITARGMLLRAVLIGGAAVIWAMLITYFTSKPTSTSANNTLIVAQPSRPAAPASDAHSDDTKRRNHEPGPKSLPSAGDPSPDASKTAVARPTPAMIAQTLASVVVIRSNDDSGAASLGTGFVVGKDGLIATNYHVMSEATEARATFANGVSYEIEGYVAVRPEEDLAIVQLRDSPPLHPLPWRRTPTLESLAAIIAIGHPSGLDFSPTDGKVSRVIQSSELPSRSRKFLRKIVSPRVNHLWIQHTANISPGSSGGPLITPDGSVVGVNTWIDGESQFGYALHVRHLKALLEAPRSEIEPLTRHAKPAARVAALLKRLSGERIGELYQRADAMNFLPQNERDYESLQQLAWSVTVSSLPSTFSLSEALDARLRELVTATARVRDKLSRRSWNNIGQLTVINDLATEALSKPMAGVVVFASVQRIVEGPGGSRGMLLKVDGHERTIFIPLDSQLEHPDEGANCLVLGVNFDGQVVRYGDNPLKLIEAPVVVSEMILPIQESLQPVK